MTIIRVADPADAAQVAAIYAPSVAETAVSFEILPPDASEMARRIDAMGRLTPWLVCDDGAALAGYAYASPHRERAAYAWSADVSVYVATDARRRHVGAGLYAALLGILRHQGYHRAYAGITLPNPPSVALHEAARFTPIGVYREVGFKLGAWRDVAWWECPLATASVEPEPPRAFAAISRDVEVARLLAAATSRVRPSVAVPTIAPR